MRHRGLVAGLFYCTAALAAPLFKVTLSNTELPRDTAGKPLETGELQIFDNHARDGYWYLVSLPDIARSEFIFALTCCAWIWHTSTSRTGAAAARSTAATPIHLAHGPIMAAGSAAKPRGTALAHMP